MPGVGRTNDPLGTPVTSYYHTDMIGTTRFMSDGVGNPTEPSVYTAFGELRQGGTNHRYAYAGSWGYQAHDEVSFLHVGHRYYEPATGRFLQRDPIGIAGGLNVYEYANANPTAAVDPEGLWPRGAMEMQCVYSSLRRQGYSPEQAAEQLRRMAGMEAVVFAAGVGVVAVGSVAGPVLVRFVLRGALRWLNKGKWRIGKSTPRKGNPKISARWKNEHKDLFDLPQWLDDLYKP